MKPTLVIGDVHGHYDRLFALLEQEGIISHTGARINYDVEVIQLGDLGHFGKGGSPTGDQMCYGEAYHGDWIDLLLWGNHDRAVVDAQHAFNGYQHPRPEVKHMILALEQRGKLQWAASRHGFLITHAGLHLRFKYNKPSIDKTNPDDVAQWINGALTPDDDTERFAVRHAISSYRGGGSPAGGILWRHIDESLYSEFPQIFGHSADRKRQVRYCTEKNHTRNFDVIPEHAKNVSYCIDIGGKGDFQGDNCLAGIWLPNERIVRVDL